MTSVPSEDSSRLLLGLDCTCPTDPGSDTRFPWIVWYASPGFVPTPDTKLVTPVIGEREVPLLAD